jgi:hypothetical protein
VKESHHVAEDLSTNLESCTGSAPVVWLSLLCGTISASDRVFERGPDGEVIGENCDVGTSVNSRGKKNGPHQLLLSNAQK